MPIIKHSSSNPSAFSKARQAITTLKGVKPSLSSSELETLALLLDPEATGIISASIKEANAGKVEPLESAIGH